MSGYPRGKLMPAANFAAGGELRIAQAIPMQCVTGDYSYDPIFPDSDPDVRLVPDYRTLKLAPWSSVPRAFAIHDCMELDGSHCAFAPRSVLKTVVERYTAQGLQAVVAPEIEFYLTAACTDPSQPLQMPPARNGRAEVGQSAFSMNMLNELAPFWDEFRDALDGLGVRADTWIHEVGPTQYEINLLHGDPVEVADQAFLFKYAAKEIAIKHGLNAVFMAKPIAREAGSSMHLHQSVVDSQGVNIFSDAEGGETAAFRHYIAGLQTYVPDLMLVFAPHVNSYRRFVSGSQAPIHLGWGYDNRTSGLRVPHSSPVARRVENRIAGADANPYLAIAATLAAGLAGMDEKLQPTAPMAAGENGYDQGHGLARSFLPALEQMQQSASARRLMGDGFVTAYTAVKSLEYDSYLTEISAWERRFLLPQV
ncbi:glutamine synthetase family protein [Curvibacter sp. APW13]|uniref:glutamine synthetase family protein n=1 Tax=Curvibacter sp. APW13 TaxID=3077236 RepID=UPI0028DEB448|nr:glutamine synthetase family protein [Curvibacter sp. APW13]MDT8990510.1 glutamine synthetase family protein [Curvibacter sp. APW13]